MSVIYTQGGAASVPDATTTTSGKVRLATIAEAGGTSEAIAVTPAGLQAEISSLANGIVYRGSIDVADFGTTLASASLGDYYKISTGGTSGGVVYSVGDSIIVNADMGGTFSDAKLDKIDNVDPSTSDELIGNHNATNYTASNSDTLTTHLSAIDAELGAFATVATSGAYADLSGTPTLATVATSGDYGDLLNAPALATVATSGDYNDLANKPSADDLAADHVATNYTAADVNIDDHLAGIDAKLGTLATVATSGAYADLSGTPTLATVATSGAYADLSGTPTLATVATSGDYNDLLNKPSADDLAADHVATNYTAADVNIDDHLAGIDAKLGTLAPLASPALTGTPTAPTATAGTNTTQIATTAFVSAAVVAAGGLSNIVEDTSPQLGAALDVNGFAITSATGSNGDVTLDPDGTGNIAIGADLIPDADGTHTIGSESARYVSTYSDLNGAIRFKAQNDEGVQIVKGQAVYIKGLAGNGTTPTVGLADADDATKMPAFGIAQNTANNGAEIQIIQVGNLTDIDTSAYNVGDTLYIDTNAGGLVATPPATESAKLQNIGRVIRKDNASGVIMVGGAGRSAATPNLNDGRIFLGDSNNRSVATALSSIALSSFNDDLSYQPLDNGLTSIANLTTSGGELLYTTASDTYATASITAAGRALLDDADAAAQRTTLGLATVASSGSYNDLSDQPSANDLAADHVATNYTATNANIDGHLAGIDTALASVGGSTNPNIYVSTSTSYAPSASDAPNLLVWYGLGNTNTFTVTLPDILTVLTGTGATGSVVESFTMWVGRGYDGDIILSSTNGIDGLGGTISYASTLTVPAGQWVKIVGWKTSSTNARYLVEVPYEAPVDSVNGATGAVVLSADDLNADHATPSNYSAADVNIDDHLVGIDTALGLRAPLASPTFTGTPAAPTATQGDNSTTLATTAYVDTAVAGAGGGGGGFTYSAITSATNAQVDYHYSCGAGNQTFTVSLPDASSSSGRVSIKNVGTGTITIGRVTATDTIDGAASNYVISNQNTAITLISNETDGWEIM
jgi:hypothetical protein